MTAISRRFIVGTAGHIDHGKTALVRALTGIDADRLPEEKARGITIDLGFAHLSRGDARIGFVDVPGHERFVRNMLAGAGGMVFGLYFNNLSFDLGFSAGLFSFLPFWSVAGYAPHHAACLPKTTRSSKFLMN